MQVDPNGYTKYGPEIFHPPPAYFGDRLFKNLSPLTPQGEKRSFSVLRDPDVARALRRVHCLESFTKNDRSLTCGFMDKIAGRKLTKLDKDLLMTWCSDACKVLRKNITSREYLSFPAVPERLVPDLGLFMFIPAYLPKGPQEIQT